MNITRSKVTPEEANALKAKFNADSLKGPIPRRICGSALIPYNNDCPEGEHRLRLFYLVRGYLEYKTRQKRKVGKGIKEDIGVWIPYRGYPGLDTTPHNDHDADAQTTSSALTIIPGAVAAAADIRPDQNQDEDEEDFEKSSLETTKSFTRWQVAERSNYTARTLHYGSSDQVSGERRWWGEEMGWVHLAAEVWGGGGARPIEDIEGVLKRRLQLAINGVGGAGGDSDAGVTPQRHLFTTMSLDTETSEDEASQEERGGATTAHPEELTRKRKRDSEPETGPGGGANANPPSITDNNIGNAGHASAAISGEPAQKGGPAVELSTYAQLNKLGLVIRALVFPTGKRPSVWWLLNSMIWCSEEFLYMSDMIRFTLLAINSPAECVTLDPISLPADSGHVFGVWLPQAHFITPSDSNTAVSATHDQGIKLDIQDARSYLRALSWTVYHRLNLGTYQQAEQSGRHSEESRPVGCVDEDEG